MVETIRGMLNYTKQGRPIYHAATSDGNLFLITLFDADEIGSIKVKGQMNSPVYGWRYELMGDWEENEKYGRTFAFNAFRPEHERASREGMIHYLSKYITSLGKERASLIVGHFGDDTLKILSESPKRIAEVDGIGPKTAAVVAERFEADSSGVDPLVYSRVYDLLSEVRPPKKIIMSLIDRFGSNAVDFIRDNPYNLLDYAGMGWDRVDRIAVGRLKYQPGGFERHVCAVRESVTRGIAESGNTIIHEEEVKFSSSQLLGMSVRDDVIPYLIEAGQLVRSGEYLTSWEMDTAERGIVAHIRRLQASFTPGRPVRPTEDLDENQSKIFDLFNNNAVVILSGIPGSGKSHTMGRLIGEIVKGDIGSASVVAPTGKAAKIDAEFLAKMGVDGVPSTTVHRALGCQPSQSDEVGVGSEDAKVNRGVNSYEFIHNESNPLPGDIFFCDETSMKEIPLAYNYLRSIPDGSRLVLAGDYKQLPSVGPGAFLRDLIDEVPTVVLSRPRRNCGSIERACYAISKGECPDPYGLSALAKAEGFPDNWTHIEIDTERGIFDSIIKTNKNYMEKYGSDRLKRELQVVSPIHKSLIGCKSLNEHIRSIVCPPMGDFDDEIEMGFDDGKFSVRPGDKVVSTKNRKEYTLFDPSISTDDLAAVVGTDEAMMMEFEGWRESAKEFRYKNKNYLMWKTQYVNGDFGEIDGIEVSGASRKIVVRMTIPDRLVVLKPTEAYIQLAYATTVHKMQGSQCPIMLAPLWSFPWNPRNRTGIWCRELVYTMLSRPRERLVTFGPIRQLWEAIKRVTLDRRKTRLRQLMRDSSQAKTISRVLSTRFDDDEDILLGLNEEGDYF